MTAPRIDPEFRDLIPPLDADEARLLEESLRRDGCRDALVTWRGLLVDGHHRLAICQEHEIAYTTATLDRDTRDDVLRWIIENQRGRRNLAPFAKAELGLKYEEIEARAATDRQAEHGGTAPGRPAETLPHNCGGVNRHSGEASERAATAAGVSRETLRRTKVLKAEAPPETLDALRRGDTTINAEYTRIKGGTPHVSQATGEQEWYTPGEYIAAARRVLGTIDLDPASSDAANEVVRATTYYTAESDGLSQEWTGRVWMNPPYASALVAAFSERLAAAYESGEVTAAIVLVNNATETRWFVRLADVASWLCFPSRRVRFWAPDKEPTGALQGQALIYLGGDGQAFVDAFSRFGILAEIHHA